MKKNEEDLETEKQVFLVISLTFLNTILRAARLSGHMKEHRRLI